MNKTTKCVSHLTDNCNKFKRLPWTKHLFCNIYFVLSIRAIDAAY